jgi:hypothetical protein
MYSRRQIETAYCRPGEDVGVNKQGHDRRPDSALFEVAQTEDKIFFGEGRVLLPCPDAGCDASEYQQWIGLQVIDKAAWS